MKNANQRCRRSVFGVHLASPDEVGFDVETSELEYFCVRCGELVRRVGISDFETQDYETLFHILTSGEDTQDDKDLKSLYPLAEGTWQDIFGETIEQTAKRIN